MSVSTSIGSSTSTLGSPSGGDPDDERPEILVERLEWQPDDGGEPLVIDLTQFFAAVFGE